MPNMLASFCGMARYACNPAALGSILMLGVQLDVMFQQGNAGMHR